MRVQVDFLLRRLCSLNDLIHGISHCLDIESDQCFELNETPSDHAKILVIYEFFLMEGEFPVQMRLYLDAGSFPDLHIGTFLRSVARVMASDILIDPSSEWSCGPQTNPYLWVLIRAEGKAYLVKERLTTEEEGIFIIDPSESEQPLEQVCTSS